ncbi:MAG: von Willebrand factor type A domain-containing protein [Bacteroidales bacterium]|nr:von Willebrand factor type A domain-containing protein [Bacteroidales bacterium]
MKKLITIAWIIILSSFTTASTDTGTLTGKVIDSVEKTPIDKAKITVYQQSKVIAEISTKKSGDFKLQLSPGTYNVEILAKGYQDAKATVHIQSGKETHVKLTLLKTNVVDELELVEDVLYCVDADVAPAKMREHYTMTIGMPAANYTMQTNDYIPIDFNTDEYSPISENIFKDALVNPLSTFSVDVDKASYANVRRFLTQSQKPYRDAVRIEELINYFDYDYPQPTDGHPFSVTLEADKCPWNEQNQLVLIGLKGENVNEEQIPPNNLVFLIDVSGSMNPANKLPLLKQAFKHLVNQLRPTDRVAIVVYAGAAGVVLESTPGTEKEKIANAIETLQAGGSTAGGEGIKLAYKIAQQNYIHGGNNRVIIGTDGDFNVGVSSTSELKTLIEQKRESGVYLTILGFGMGNYKDGRMKELSMAGNGNYAYIDNIMEAKKVFGTELWGTLYTIANDVKIQVEFNPAKVKEYRLIGYEKRMLNSEDFNNDKKDAGDIGCGHTVTALYEIVPAYSDDTNTSIDPLKYTQQTLTNSNELLSVKLRYKNPGESTSQLITQVLIEAKTESTSNLQFASSVAEFGMLLRESEFKGTSSFANALGRAKKAKGNDEFGYKTDFIKMVEMAEMIYR